jgi:hypothetical protein
MKDELERTWVEMAVGYLKALSSHLALGAEENHDKPSVA